MAAGRSPSEFRRRIARLLGEPVREPLQASRSGLALVALATVALAVGVVWAEPSEKAPNRAELTASGESKSEAGESDETAEKLVERLAKLLPPLTEADRAVANARARTFGLGAVDHISMRDQSWSGPVTETFQPDDGSLASLWAARGKQVDEKMRRLADFTTTVAWSGPQLLVQLDSPMSVGAETPPGLYTQSRYWDGVEGWLGEISPEQRRIYQYAQVDKLMEYLIPAQFPFWEGAGGQLPWQGGAVVLREYQVAPELTRYQHEGTETIDGVECDVYAGPARSERLWIEKASGLVKATSRYYWGESLPNYATELVAEAAGRAFRDEREYHDWLKQQPAKAQELLTAHSAAAHWPLMKPGNLTVYSDYRELQPEVEFPMRAERVVVHPNHPGEGFKYYRSEAEVTDVTEKFDIRKLAVQALPRVGDAMTDRRAEPPVDYTWPDNQVAAQTTTRDLRDAKAAEMKNKAEQDRLINETPINSVADSIKVLTEGPNVEPTKVWVRAIKYLADHKEEALPAVVAALDEEERDHPISKLAFALRAMGDPRAVPALIRALPKTLVPSRSDYGLPVDGGGDDHDELLRFITAHDQGDGDDGDMFTYGRAFREVAVTLQKLTDQDFDEMELNWIHRSEAPAQVALQREQFHRVAQRWAEWWEANWRTMVDEEAYASVNLPPLAKAVLPQAAARQSPSGPGVRMEDTRSGWIVQSAHESTDRCFVDLDTMREGGWPESLPPIEEIGADSPELLAWARREGFDLMGVSFTPPGETEPLYCLMPLLGMDVRKITPRELQELKKGATVRRIYSDSQVKLMVPQRKIMPPFDHEVGGDSFLYLTQEGTAGVVRMTAQVPKDSPPGGYSDDQFEPTGFYPGAKVTFAELRKSDAAEPPTNDEAPLPDSPAPKSTKPANPPTETAPKDQSSTIQKLKVIVVDEAGQPIEGALVRQNHVHLPPGVPDDGKHLEIKNENYRTDMAGEATVTWEGESVDLRIWASHPDRVPLHAMWAPKFQTDGDKIPAEFRFELQPGTTIGGVVRDEAGEPVVGAKVDIVNQAAFTLAGPTTQPGKRPVAVPWLAEGDSAVVTDAEGRWKATNIPSDEELNRPQYVEGRYVQDGKIIHHPQDDKGMRIAPKFLGPPLRLQITHEKFAPYDGWRDWQKAGAPSLSELREEKAIVVVKPKVKKTENANAKASEVRTESAPTISGPY